MVKGRYLTKRDKGMLYNMPLNKKQRIFKRTLCVSNVFRQFHNKDITQFSLVWFDDHTRHLYGPTMLKYYNNLSLPNHKIWTLNIKSTVYLPEAQYGQTQSYKHARSCFGW